MKKTYRQSSNIRDAGDRMKANPFRELAARKSLDLAVSETGRKLDKGGDRLKHNPFEASMNSAKVRGKVIMNARDAENKRRYPGGSYDPKTGGMHDNVSPKGNKPNKFDAKKYRDLAPTQP